MEEPADPDGEAVHALCLEYQCEEPGHVRTTDVPHIIHELSRLFGEMPPSNEDLAAVISNLDDRGMGYVSNIARARATHPTPFQCQEQLSRTN